MLDPYENTAAYVSQCMTKARRHSNPWHKKINHWRDLYDRNHYPNRPKQGEERFNDPTYTNVVDLTVGTILANDMEFRAFGWSPSAKEQKDTDKIEKFLMGLIQINSERSEVLIPYEVLLNFTRDGCGVLYTVWDPRLEEMYYRDFEIPDEDSEEDPTQLKQVGGYIEPPIRVQSLDPTSIFVIPGGPGRWLEIIRVEEKSVVDVEMEFGVQLSRYDNLHPNEKLDKMGELRDYWRYKEEYITELDEVGEPVIKDGKAVTRLTPIVEHAITYENDVIIEMQVMQNYHALPFTIGFFKPVDSKDPEKWGHSINEPLEDTIAMLERAINRRQRQITVYSSLPLTAHMEGNRKVKVDASLGAVVHLGPNEQLTFPTWQGNAPDMEMQISFLRARSQQTGFSDVMFGSGPSQVSGYGLSQLGDQNRIRLEQPVQHLQLFWARWAKQALQLAASMAPDMMIRVYGLLRGEDFQEQVFAKDLAEYNVRCLIKPEFPNDKVRNHAMATQVRGILSENRIMQDYLGVEQPDEEQQRKLIEMAQKDPMVIRYGVIQKLTEMARSGDEIAAVVLKELNQQQNIPNNAAPANAPNPQQMSGMQSANGQPTPQAMGQPPPGQSESDMISQLAGLSPNMGGGIG